jgi:hypothetical protein
MLRSMLAGEREMCALSLGVGVEWILGMRRSSPKKTDKNVGNIIIKSAE